jgi:hypothetical protein
MISTHPCVAEARRTLNPNRLYLDSTLSFQQVFTNEHLDHLCPKGTTPCANCNAGTMFATKKGWYLDLFHLWLVRNGLANLLSLPQLEDNGFYVEYHKGRKWVVTTPQGNEIVFKHKEEGICRGFTYIDMQTCKGAIAMAQTIRQHYERFMNRKVQDAIQARKTQAMIGHPTDAQLKHMVSNRLLKKIPLKPDHITNAHSIYGSSIAGVLGKTVRRKHEHVEVEYGNVPDNFHRLHKFVTLTADVMLINRIAFLTALSQKLQMATVEHIPLCTAAQLSNSIMKIVKLYASTGFIVRLVMMDQKFDKVDNIVNMVKINTTVAREHIGEIECNIRVIKERSHAIVSDLPYKILPRQVIIHLVYFSVLWLNSLPSTVGVSEKYSSQGIVTGRELDFNKHCKTTF